MTDFPVCPHCRSTRIRGEHCPGQMGSKSCVHFNCHVAAVCDNCEYEWAEGCQNEAHRKIETT